MRFNGKKIRDRAFSAFVYLQAMKNGKTIKELNNHMPAGGGKC